MLRVHAASTQGLGNARNFKLLWQLGEAKQQLKKEVQRLRDKAEDGLKKAKEKNAKLLKAHSWDAQADVRRAKEETARVRSEWNEMVHKLKVRQRTSEEARQNEGRQEVRIAELKTQLVEVRAEMIRLVHGQNAKCGGLVRASIRCSRLEQVQLQSLYPMFGCSAGASLKSTPHAGAAQVQTLKLPKVQG